MPPSGEVHLREYVDTLFSERDHRYAQRFAAQERATDLAVSQAEKATLKAEEAINARLLLLNELRTVVTDQAATFLTRKEAIAILGLLVALMSAGSALIIGSR